MTLTLLDRSEIEQEARPTLRRAMRRGLVIGFALGFVACCVIVAFAR